MESKYIAKSGLFKVPFGGWAMSLAGDIPVYFTAEKDGWGTAKGSVGRMMETCKQLIEDGSPIMVFPEGVRAGCMQAREYKNGMFQFAIENGCAILPIALNNTHKAWSRKDVLDVADMHLRIGEVIQPKTTDVEELKALVRGAIQKMVDGLPNTNYDDIPEAKDAKTPAAKPSVASDVTAPIPNKKDL